CCQQLNVRYANRYAGPAPWPPDAPELPPSTDWIRPCRRTRSASRTESARPDRLLNGLLSADLPNPGREYRLPPNQFAPIPADDRRSVCYRPLPPAALFPSR